METKGNKTTGNKTAQDNSVQFSNAPDVLAAPAETSPKPVELSLEQQKDAAQVKIDTAKADIMTAAMAGKFDVVAVKSAELSAFERTFAGILASMKYAKLMSFMGEQAVNLHALAMETGSYNVRIDVASDGTVSTKVIGGQNTVQHAAGAGEGGKGIPVIVAGTTYTSGSAACKALGVEVGADSPIRKLRAHCKANNLTLVEQR